MEEEQGFYRNRRYRKKSVDSKAETPTPQFPPGTTISAKNIAFLYIHCGKQPSDIVAAYPRLVTLAEIHLALAHYYQNREAMDAEFERERSLLSNDALSDGTASLPSVGIRSLIETFFEM